MGKGLNTRFGLQNISTISIVRDSANVPLRLVLSADIINTGTREASQVGTSDFVDIPIMVFDYPFGDCSYWPQSGDGIGREKIEAAALLH